jgi:hypothetical protein
MKCTPIPTFDTTESKRRTCLGRTEPDSNSSFFYS